MDRLYFSTVQSKLTVWAASAVDIDKTFAALTVVC